MRGCSINFSSYDLFKISICLLLSSTILKILATCYSHPANPSTLPTCLCSRGLSPQKHALLDAAEPHTFQFPPCSRTCWRGVDAPQKLPIHLPHLESACNTLGVNTRLDHRILLHIRRSLME